MHHITSRAPWRYAGTAVLAISLASLSPAAHSQGVKDFLQSVGSSIGNTLSKGPSASSSQADDLLSLLVQSLDNIDEAKEIEIGRQLAALLLGAKRAHPDMALQRYVNRLGRWISLQSSRPGLPWTFVVLDNPGYNAFAAPGGYVFVTKGLVDRCADESELAGILAHEITHVTAKHHLQAMRQSAMAGLGTQLLAKHIKAHDRTSQYVKDQFLSLFKNVYTKGLSQTDEFEADRGGVVLATKAGFDPYGMMAALQQLRWTAADNPAYTFTMSTHPSPQSRLDALEQAMGHQFDGLGGARGPIAQRAGAGKPTPPAARPAGKPQQKAG